MPDVIVNTTSPKQDSVTVTEGSTVPVPTVRSLELEARSDANQSKKDKIGIEKEANLVRLGEEQDALDKVAADQLDKAAALEKEQAEEIKKHNRLLQDGREHALGELAEMQKKVENYKIHDYFANKSTGDRVVGALTVIGGGVGAALQNAGAALIGQSGHYTNLAAEALERAIKQDFEEQKAQLAADQAALTARGAAADRVAAFGKQHLMEIEAEQLLAKKALKAEAEAEMKRRGLPAAQIERTLGILDQKLNIAKDTEAYLNNQAHLETPKFAQKQQQRQTQAFAPATDTSGMDQAAPKNEAQAKAQNYGDAMARGLNGMTKAMEGLTKADVDVVNGARAGVINRILSGEFSEAFVQGERQKIQDAVNEGRATKAALDYYDGFAQYANNKLRQDSGASIGKEETAGEIDRTMISRGEKATDYAKRLREYALPAVKGTLSGGFRAGTNAKTEAELRAGLDSVAGDGKGAKAAPIYEVGGKRYRLGADGDTLEPIE